MEKFNIENSSVSKLQAEAKGSPSIPPSLFHPARKNR